jgi:hypothetical protein
LRVAVREYEIVVGIQGAGWSFFVVLLGPVRGQAYVSDISTGALTYPGGTNVATLCIGGCIFGGR